MLKDTQLGIIQTQTVLMSNKVREKLKICKSTKTTVSYTDAEMCASQKTVFLHVKHNAEGPAWCSVPGWSSATVQSQIVSVPDSASVTEILLYSTFPSTFSLLFNLKF